MPTMLHLLIPITDTYHGLTYMVKPLKNEQMVVLLIIHRAHEQADEASLESIVNEQQVEPKVEVPHKQTEVSQVGDKALLKPQLEKKADVPRKPQLCIKEPVNKDAEVKSQHSHTVEMVAPVPKHDERQIGSEPAIKQNENKTAEKILESDPIKNCAAPSPQNTTLVEEEKAKSAALRKAETQLLIIGESFIP